MLKASFFVGDANLRRFVEDRVLLGEAECDRESGDSTGAALLGDREFLSGLGDNTGRLYRMGEDMMQKRASLACNYCGRRMTMF